MSVLARYWTLTTISLVAALFGFGAIYIGELDPSFTLPVMLFVMAPNYYVGFFLRCPSNFNQMQGGWRGAWRNRKYGFVPQHCSNCGQNLWEKTSSGKPQILG